MSFKKKRDAQRNVYSFRRILLLFLHPMVCFVAAITGPLNAKARIEGQSFIYGCD